MLIEQQLRWLMLVFLVATDVYMIVAGLGPSIRLPHVGEYQPGH